MATRCSNLDCAYPDAGKCARGFDDPGAQCGDWQTALIAAGSLAKPRTTPSTPPPAAQPAAANATEASEEAASVEIDAGYDGNFWSGYALGGDEAASLLWDPRPLLFTIVGGTHRGKTCLLTAFYIQLVNGLTGDFPYRFCGSRSFEGFQRLANPAFAWKGGEERIVPRTTASSFRQPSFLHLALKQTRPAEKLYDPPQHVLFTDMPGEWFDTWIDLGDAALQGSLEFLPRTDGVLLTLDAPRLMNDGAYRRNSLYLFDRLVGFLTSGGFSRRPLAIVLTKYDKVVGEVGLPKGDRRDPAAWGQLQTSIRKFRVKLDETPQIPWDIFPCAAFWRPTAAPLGVLDPFDFLLRETTRRRPMDTIAAPRDVESRYMCMFREGGEE